MSGLGLDVEPGVRLVLREAHLTEQMAALTTANLTHLSPWENWAADYDPAAASRWNEQRLALFTTGSALPLCIEVDGTLVGAMSARIDGYMNTAELGYWIDAGHQGRGLISRCVHRLVDHLFDDRDIARVEIRTAAHNVRSRRVAERVGFRHEGTLRSAQRLGDRRVDDVVYGLLPADRAWLTD